MKFLRIGIIMTAILAAAAITVIAGIHDKSTATGTRAPATPKKATLPVAPESYLGIYTHGVPNSYAPVTASYRSPARRDHLLQWMAGTFPGQLRRYGR
jgi:hypothetical protein